MDQAARDIRRRHLFGNGGELRKFMRRKTPAAAGDFDFVFGYLSKQQDQDDQRDRDPDQPKKNGHRLSFRGYAVSG
jgi:hypothetical protein